MKLARLEQAQVRGPSPEPSDNHSFNPTHALRKACSCPPETSRTLSCCDGILAETVSCAAQITASEDACVQAATIRA